MNHIGGGLYYLIAGFGLITKPGLRRYAVLPVLVNLFIFIAMFVAMAHYLSLFNAWFDGLLPHWLQWLNWVVWVFFAVSFFLLFIFTFVTFANIIAAPFNSLLAERVAVYLKGHVVESRGWYENLKDVPRIFARQAAILLYLVPRFIGLLLLFWIPLVQVVAPPLWFLFNAWLMTLTYVDYPADNQRVSFADMRCRLDQKRWASLGFGASVLLVSMVPLLNLFVMPAAVAGATQFWLEAMEE